MKNESFLSMFSKRMDLHCEPGSSHVLIEMVDDRWVLIEKHCGVIGYTKEIVTVKIPKGYVCVQGMNLQLGKMSREQLKIYGVIHSIKFNGRD